MVPVWWPTGGPRSWWDQALVEALFAGELWRPVRPFADIATTSYDRLNGIGAIVPIAGQHAAAQADEIIAKLAGLEWCIVLLGGDEEALFPFEKLRHPNMSLWVQTPRMPRHLEADRLYPFGWPPVTRQLLAEQWARSGFTAVAYPKLRSWFFAGQAPPHQPNRQACVAVLERMIGQGGNGELHPTKGFGQMWGDSTRSDYLHQLMAAKIAPCPSGPHTPDTFRVWEALEAGCLPVVESGSDRGTAVDYWGELVGPDAFPVIDEWTQFPDVAAAEIIEWPAGANRAGSWWQQRRREMAYWLRDDIERLSGRRARAAGLADLITVLVPSSPIPSHPGTEVLIETVESIRDRLPSSEIILMLDGVRTELEHRRHEYEEYIRNVLWLCNHRWRNVLPIRHERHLHQAGMTRRALSLVRTPLVLFVEHDTPLVGGIPFAELADVLLADDADLIRLHHESRVLPDHEYLMLDQVRQLTRGVPLLRTIQWSQRPHLATTSFYRRVMETYFGWGSSTMIEDLMHGVVRDTYRTRGWGEFRLYMYAPPGDMKRSTHLDGRGGDPKFDDRFVIAYDDAPPSNAPQPTKREEK